MRDELEELYFEVLRTFIDAPNKGAVADAFYDGRICLEGKKVIGKFNSAVSIELRKLGGSLDGDAYVFTNTPVILRALSCIYTMEDEARLDRLKLVINEIKTNIDSKANKVSYRANNFIKISLYRLESQLVCSGLYKIDNLRGFITKEIKRSQVVFR